MALGRRCQSGCHPVQSLDRTGDGNLEYRPEDQPSARFGIPMDRRQGRTHRRHPHDLRSGILHLGRIQTLELDERTPRRSGFPDGRLRSSCGRTFDFNEVRSDTRYGHPPLLCLRLPYADPAGALLLVPQRQPRHRRQPGPESRIFEQCHGIVHLPHPA